MNLRCVRLLGRVVEVIEGWFGGYGIRVVDDGSQVPLMASAMTPAVFDHLSRRREGRWHRGRNRAWGRRGGGVWAVLLLCLTSCSVEPGVSAGDVGVGLDAGVSDGGGGIDGAGDDGGGFDQAVDLALGDGGGDGGGVDVGEAADFGVGDGEVDGRARDGGAGDVGAGDVGAGDAGLGVDGSPGVDGGVGMDGGVGADGGVGLDGGVGMDGGGVVELAVLHSDPPRVGWRRGGQLEVAVFDRERGPGVAEAVGPVGAQDGRFVGEGARVVVGWSFGGDAWLGPDPVRVAVGAAMRGVALVPDAVVVLVSDGVPGQARLVRVGVGGGERRFAVEPDARELLGVAAGGGEVGVLVGDGQAGALWVYWFDEGLAPLGRELVCDVGCDRPGARVVGGPAVAVVFQAVGQVHLRVGGEARAVAGVVRGSLLDAGWSGRWVVAWSRPVGGAEGVYVEGVPLRVGPVQGLGWVEAGCAVWLQAGGVGWGCGT